MLNYTGGRFIMHSSKMKNNINLYESTNSLANQLWTPFQSLTSFPKTRRDENTLNADEYSTELNRKKQ